jgi:hypothetical protein
VIILKTALRNAVTQYTYWEEEYDCPLGVLWARFAVGQSGERLAMLMNAITIPTYRRRGVASSLIFSVFNDASTLLSACGSGDGGEQLLRKLGFVYSEVADLWYLKSPIKEGKEGE